MVDASLDLIDYLERQIAQINKQLRSGGADHPYVSLLLTVSGIGCVLPVHDPRRDRGHHAIPPHLRSFAATPAYAPPML
jgi:hypothetical protein